MCFDFFFFGIRTINAPLILLSKHLSLKNNLTISVMSWPITFHIRWGIHPTSGFKGPYLEHYIFYFLIRRDPNELYIILLRNYRFNQFFNTLLVPVVKILLKLLHSSLPMAFLDESHLSWLFLIFFNFIHFPFLDSARVEEFIVFISFFKQDFPRFLSPWVFFLTKKVFQFFGKFQFRRDISVIGF